jgi:hypothetical protein
MEIKMAVKKITISGQTFEVGQPYAAGHQLNEAEARSLNQTRAENIGNNFRKAVKEAGDDPAKLNEVANQLAAYDAKYTFAMGGGAREPVDPVDREAMAIAKKAVKGSVEQKYGVKLSEWLKTEGNQEKYDAAVESVSQRDNVIAQAKNIVKARAKGAGDIEGI